MEPLPNQAQCLSAARTSISSYTESIELKKHGVEILYCARWYVDFDFALNDVEGKQRLQRRNIAVGYSIN